MKKEKKLPNKKVRLLLKNKENRLVWVTVDVKITKEYEDKKWYSDVRIFIYTSIL